MDCYMRNVKAGGHGTRDGCGMTSWVCGRMLEPRGISKSRQARSVPAVSGDFDRFPATTTSFCTTYIIIYHLSSPHSVISARSGVVDVTKR